MGRCKSATGPTGWAGPAPARRPVVPGEQRPQRAGTQCRPHSPPKMAAAREPAARAAARQRLTARPAHSLCPSPTQGAEPEPKKPQSDWRRRSANRYPGARAAEANALLPTPAHCATALGKRADTAWAAPEELGCQRRRDGGGMRALTAAALALAEGKSSAATETGYRAALAPGGRSFFLASQVYRCTLPALNPVPALPIPLHYCPCLGACQIVHVLPTASGSRDSPGQY